MGDHRLGGGGFVQKTTTENRLNQLQGEKLTIGHQQFELINRT